MLGLFGGCLTPTTAKGGTKSVPLSAVRCVAVALHLKPQRGCVPLLRFGAFGGCLTPTTAKGLRPCFVVGAWRFALHLKWQRCNPLLFGVGVRRFVPSLLTAKGGYIYFSAGVRWSLYTIPQRVLNFSKSTFHNSKQTADL